MERTFSIIKPDAVANGHVGDIISILEKERFRIIGLRFTRLTTDQAERFYAVHMNRPFFRGLVSFMTEGPVVVLALERENAVSKLREIMGATNPANAAEGTLRRQFAQSIERNAIHGSDAAETAAQEIPFFFSHSEL